MTHNITSTNNTKLSHTNAVKTFASMMNMIAFLQLFCLEVVKIFNKNKCNKIFRG